MKNNLLFLSCMGISLCGFPAAAGERTHGRAGLECPKGLTALLDTFPLQTITITGTVRDAAGPLPGVTVRVKGNRTVTLTDSEGRYAIMAETGDVLLFSYVGYREYEVTVTTANIIDAILQEDATSLQEVTVNAGYYRVTDRERTGSIAKITSKEIGTQPVTNVLATMQGRMAGVNITQTTGVPGGSFDIQIRGLNSVRTGGNSPLYIVDGVPYAADAIGTGINSAVLPYAPSPLNSLNPEQVESIEVLKDADATAIYGSRGANGVVLITTKKGKAGATRYNVDVSTGMGSITRRIDLLDTAQYLAMREEAFRNDGIGEFPAQAYDVNGTWDRNRNTDWQRELLGQTAHITNAQLSMSGGTAQTQFLVGGSFNRQGTVYDGDFAYRKSNLHLQLGHASADQRFKASFSAGYTLQDNNQPRVDLMVEALRLAPNAPDLYDADGELNWEGSTWENPLRHYEGQYGATTRDLMANSTLSYLLLPGLELRSGFGYTTLRNAERTAAPSTMFDPAFGVTSAASSLIVSAADRSSWIAEPQLHWKGRLGKARLELLVGATFQSQGGSQLAQYAEGFSSNSLIRNIGAASNLFTVTSDNTEYRYQAFFGRANLIWDDRYILNLTGRRDGSSRFGPGKQFANFGAAGVAWLFSREALLKDSNVLSHGKLRGSYGVTGSDQIGDYQYLDTYAPSGVLYGGVMGLRPTRLFNPDFGWETNRKMEAALELGFLRDRIMLTAGWYRNTSGNQLAGIPLPGTTGFNIIQANLEATVQNRGLELTLQAVNMQGRDFKWTSSLNFTQERNKLVEFPGLETSTYRNTYAIGQPLNIRKMYHFTGVDPETGLYTFEDVNGDGRLTAAEDKKQVVDFTPAYYGGLHNDLRYGNWQLGFLFQFVRQQNFNSAVNFGAPGTSNQPVTALDRWQEPGDVSDHQRFTSGSNGAAMSAYNRYRDSDAAVSDASYVRLRNLSISYTLPATALKGVQCRMFVEGQNLLTFTKFEGADPEFKAAGYLPPLKVISAGMQFNF
ncbi:SusC/RagA family TonB-linked outer membrane protein [Flavobacterium soli]|uniref:SusC/RagA family TonB-linked outer membrane protein n=1 Tax=Flavobacterium soli TaxID=344881 RepID=UPI00041556E0|nr:SusC/RagA family TonB-linked outer membrane protein [Flavobacterium soli]